MKIVAKRKAKGVDHEGDESPLHGLGFTLHGGVGHGWNEPMYRSKEGHGHLL
jgi:hypothetical protein